MGANQSLPVRLHLAFHHVYRKSADETRIGSVKKRRQKCPFFLSSCVQPYGLLTNSADLARGAVFGFARKRRPGSQRIERYRGLRALVKRYQIQAIGLRERL